MNHFSITIDEIFYRFSIECVASGCERFQRTSSSCARTDVVAESGVKYNAADEYEHRCAEHEHDFLSLWLLLEAFLKPPDQG
jgi:hypothetical protein